MSRGTVQQHYSTDENGEFRLDSETKQIGPEMEEKSTHTYINNNEIIETTLPGDKTRTQVKTDGKLMSETNTQTGRSETVTYDENGKPTSKTILKGSDFDNPDVKNQIRYNKDGSRTESFEQPAKGIQITDHYNNKGFKTKETAVVKGKTYTATATGKVSVGTFLCDDDFNVRAIVYDTENLNREQYGYGRAMAVNEAADNTSWSNAETLPSSASKYITSSVMTDLRGYEVSDYFKGNAENAAVNIAATYQNSLQGCSDWYLPSVGEWMNFWNNLGGMTKINILLRQAGAAELNGVKYWTASLRGLTDPYAIMENGGNLMPVAQPLHSKNGVRASVMF